MNLTLGATATPSSPFTGAIGRVRIHDEPLDNDDLLHPVPPPPPNPKINGYRGIWFNLGQYGDFGPKYSGGFATYTAKHRPLAVYDAVSDKTFFTYGGTTAAHEKHLLIMASFYDHAAHRVHKPTVVMDKNGVDDPHDNAAIQLDEDGYVYIFVSGRNTSRNGFIYKSTEPRSTAQFELISPSSGLSFTYPQIWRLPGNGSDLQPAFFHLFNRYTSGREMYIQTSPDAVTWSPSVKIAAGGGHYQVSAHHGETVGSAFNRHPDGDVDARTDLYYLQTSDRGRTWTGADGITPLPMPMDGRTHASRVIDYAAQNRLVYMKDLVFDDQGRPVIFYLTSAHHQPGPQGEPRLLTFTRWSGSDWVTTTLPPSATETSTVIHNYSSGSLHIEGDIWTVVAPTKATPVPGPGATQAEKERYWGQGGEMETWISADQGATWTKQSNLTRNSPRKHGYARMPQNGKDPFFSFWADGNPEAMTEVHLYFANRDGSQVWKLPYNLDDDSAEPEGTAPAFYRLQRGM
ncbi:MAG: BNR-4 repeat-containing protein [Opitutales bacterium]